MTVTMSACSERASPCACSHCSADTNVSCSISTCEICPDCLEHLKEIVIGEKVGCNFINSALRPDSNRKNYLDDSPPPRDRKLCSFCHRWHKTCSELFPGSLSQICNACFEKFSVRSEDDSCLRCDTEPAAQGNTEFLLCSACINDFLEELNRKVVSNTCTMCNCTTQCSSLGNFSLCGICLERLRSTRELPAMRPKPGEIVYCRILRPGDFGLDVHVGKSIQRGGLVTRAKLRRGTIVKAEFVCWFRGIILLTPVEQD